MHNIKGNDPLKISGRLISGDIPLITYKFSPTGGVINPMLELIYQSPRFREFQFDFTFYPRDEKEALNVPFQLCSVLFFSREIERRLKIIVHKPQGIAVPFK